MIFPERVFGNVPRFGGGDKLRPAAIPLNFFPEILNRLDQSLRQRHMRLPFQKFPRAGDVGLALLGVVLRQRLENDFTARTGGVDYFTRELQYGN